MKTLLGLMLAAMFALAVGCSNDSVAPPDDSTATPTVTGTIGNSEFELTFAASGGNARHEGPFVLRGFNVQYVDTLNALSVDFTVTNRGRVAHAEPIGLTFLKLMPDTVTVQNPDNGINGPGAAIVFSFANDDAMWTPGETSLPRTVLFGVGPGVSIAFIARLDIGGTPPQTGGAIGGLVWNDANEDGVVDPGEPGIPNVPVALRNITNDASTIVEPAVRAAKTGPDGRYRFDHLRAGVYVVSKIAAAPWIRPTTPTEITVVLTMKDGVVSDFLDANFGCVVTVPPPPPPPPLEVGDHVDAAGEFFSRPLPLHLIATEFAVTRCDDDTIPTPGVVGNSRCDESRLRGPVTAVYPERSALEIMGTPVHFREFPKDVQPRDRLDVRVERAGNVGGWVATEWQKWEGEHEGVSGRVDDVQVGQDGVLRVLVVDLWVIPAHIVGPPRS